MKSIAIVGMVLASTLSSTPSVARSLSIECVGIISKDSAPGYLTIAKDRCVFLAKSVEGRKILKVCPIGTRCRVRGNADNSATVPFGDKLYEVDSVHRLGSPALDARAKKEKEADERRKRDAVFPYEERTTNCVVGWIKDEVSQDAVDDALEKYCARQRDALVAEYVKQFGPGGRYLYMDYRSNLSMVVQERQKSQRGEKKPTTASFAKNGAVDVAAMPPGFTAFAFLHPDWHLGFKKGDKSAEKLIFRRFAYEGKLRNIFVLSCPKDDRTRITVEIIPPTALEETLRKNATAKLQSSMVTVESEGGTKLNLSGEFDKIAAFVDFQSDDDFHKFLRLAGEFNGYSYISVPGAKLKFGLSIGENLPELFKAQSPNYFERDDVEQLSWQDVFIRCGEFREK
jgi:hypothetical protein